MASDDRPTDGPERIYIAGNSNGCWYSTGIETDIPYIRADLALTEAEVLERLRGLLHIIPGWQRDSAMATWNSAVHACARALFGKGPDEESGL